MLSIFLLGDLNCCCCHYCCCCCSYNYYFRGNATDGSVAAIYADFYKQFDLFKYDCYLDAANDGVKGKTALPCEFAVLLACLMLDDGIVVTFSLFNRSSH